MKLPFLMVLLFLAWSDSTLGQPLKEIRIGSSDISFSNFSTYYARDRKFFEKEGFDAKIIIVKTEAALPALSTGELDYTTFSTSAIDAALRGLPLRLIAVTVKQPVIGLVVREGVNQVHDLKGKRIGISSLGGLTHVAALAVLKHYGLNPKDVTLLAIGSGVARLVAMRKGGLDAALMNSPQDIQAVKEGFKVLLDVGTVYQLPFGGLSTTLTKMGENPAEVKQVIRAVLLATQALVKPENRDDAINHAAALFKIERGTAAEFHRRMVSALSPTGVVEMDKIRLAIDSAVERGLIHKPLEPEAVVDFSLVRNMRF
jgi:ABC-type nitrate/sulfonate/bicarbonate transport system substrate-binding protein